MEFIISIGYSGIISYNVDANNQDDAIEIAEKCFEEEEAERIKEMINYTEICDIEEVK